MIALTHNPLDFAAPAVIALAALVLTLRDPNRADLRAYYRNTRQRAKARQR